LGITDLIKRKPLVRRHRKWRKLRKRFLKKNKVCACCGRKKKLEVHHIVPVHIDRSLELCYENLITLCESKKYGITCHLFVGHKGNYKKFNPEVKDMASSLSHYLGRDC